MKHFTFQVITLTATAIFCGNAFALNPQPEPPSPEKRMTAEKFKSLPDDALIGKITKRQLIQQFEKSKAETLPKTALDNEIIKSAVNAITLDHQRKMKIKLDEGNQKLELLIRSSAKTSVARASVIKPTGKGKIIPLKPLPVIAEVILASVNGKPAARPGGWIAIKGDNLEEFCPGNPGKVFLKGNFPGGFVQLVAKSTSGCSGHAIMTVVPDIIGVMDQQTKLVLQTANKRMIEAIYPTDFIAKQKIKMIDQNIVTVKECSTNANFNNYCTIYQPSWLAKSVHQNLPESAATQGIDTFQYNFANGYKLVLVTNGMGCSAGFKCEQSGDYLSKTKWSLPATTNNMYADSCYCFSYAVGPEGVSMK